MKRTQYKFTTTVWLYPGHAGWHFVTVPKKIGQMIKKETEGKRRGWGSVPVLVTIGKAKFETSIFPEKTSGSFLLPVKAQVRKTEEIEEGEKIKVALMLRV